MSAARVADDTGKHSTAAWPTAARASITIEFSHHADCAHLSIVPIRRAA
jgi:hypothetical protein